MDIGTHGTHVAGIAAAVANNASGIAGLSWAQIMPLKVSTDGTTIDEAAAVEAIEYAAMMRSRGVPIVAINASYGSAASYSQIEYDAIAAAGDAGIVFCAAAGNMFGPSPNDNDVTPVYPASYDCSNIIAVAATDADDALADYSNFGAISVDLAAPGDNILSTWPMDSSFYGTIVGATNTFVAGGVQYAGFADDVSEMTVYCGLGRTNDIYGVVFGRIALIQRGEITFEEKVRNAANGGAMAVIIYNNAPGWIGGVTLRKPDEWIPVVHITGEDGATLSNQTPTWVTISALPGEDFKNGTSMATPLVAGGVALAALHYPQETLNQRISRILSAVDTKSGLLSKVSTGGRLNARKILDGDADDIPDWWETLFVPNVTNMNASTDLDADGFLDHDEFSAGTSPVDDTSLLLVKYFHFLNSNSVRIAWFSTNNSTYSVQRATNLAAPFSVVASNIVGTPPINYHTNTIPADAASVFYRIAVE